MSKPTYVMNRFLDAAMEALTYVLLLIVGLLLFRWVLGGIA